MNKVHVIKTTTSARSRFSRSEKLNSILWPWTQISRRKIDLNAKWDQKRNQTEKNAIRPWYLNAPLQGVSSHSSNWCFLKNDIRLYSLTMPVLSSNGENLAQVSDCFTKEIKHKQRAVKNVKNLWGSCKILAKIRVLRKTFLK